MGLPVNNFHSIYQREGDLRSKFHRDLVFLPKEREASGIVIDGNSVLRNGASLIGTIRPLPSFVRPLISGSALLGGALGLPTALLMTRDSYRKGKEGIVDSDREKIFHTALSGIVGASYAGVSSLLIAEGAMGLKGAVVPAAIGSAIGVLGLIMSGAMVGYSGYGWKKSSEFGNQLEEIRSKEGDQGVFRWLREQTTLTNGERKNLSESEIVLKLRQKWNGLELRIGNSAARLLREAFSEDQTDRADLRGVVEAVHKGNFKEQVKYSLLILISLISIAAFIAMMVTVGPLSFALFGVGALTWLTVDAPFVYNYIGEKLYSRLKIAQSI